MDYNVSCEYDEAKRRWDVTVKGEIDIYNFAAFKEQLISITREVPGDLRIDCAELKYIDSTGLGALVAVLKTVREFGGSVILTHLQPSIDKLLRITNLNKVFTIGGGESD